MAAFRIGAHNLVSISSRSWDLHPNTAHGAVVGDCLWLLLLLYLLYALEIAQDGLRAGCGPSDLIGVRICILRNLLGSESELNFDSSTFLLTDWGLARLSLLESLPLSLWLSLRSSTIGPGPWWITLGRSSGRWLGRSSGRWLGRSSGRGSGRRRGSARRRGRRFLFCSVSHAIGCRRCGCPLKESGGCWAYSCRV